MSKSCREGGGCLGPFTSAIISEGQGKLRPIAGGGTLASLDSDKLPLPTFPHTTPICQK